MKHFSILIIGLLLVLPATDTVAQTQSSQPSEQDAATQNPRRKMQRNRAGKKRGERRRQKLAQMDADKDQRISRDEWKRRPQAFDRLDADRDGFLTREELNALREKRRKRNNANATKPPLI